MIIFVHHGRHAYTHSELAGQAGLCPVAVCNYRWLLSQSRLPRGSYIFTDRERMDQWELRVYAALFRHINNAGPAYRAINDPARMANRRSLLRALYAENCNDFNAYSLTERRLPERWPVFLRREFDHAQPLTGLLRDRSELDAAVKKLVWAGEPEDGLLVVEYCAQPVSGKLFRKLSSYRVGDQTFFYNTVHEENWLVKYGTINSATNALYEDEQSMLHGNAYAKEISRAFDIAGIDYGRADFGLVNGRVQVYEINTNPTTRPPQDHPNPVRSETQRLAWEKYCAALNALDTTDPAADEAPVFEHPGLIRLRTDGGIDIRVAR